MHDAGLLAVGNARKLHTPGSRPLSRCRAALSASPRARRPLVGRRAGRHRVRVAGPLWPLAPPPLPPAAPRVANRGARPGLRASAPGTDRAYQAGGPVARQHHRQSPSRRHGGAKKKVLNPSAAPEAGGPPRCLGVPRTIARRSPARARPGPPPPPRRAANCCLAGARPPLLPRC